DFETALRLPSEHQYGNDVAIFTRNGHAAREFAARVNVGMVGINVPIPVPVAYHTFGGWKRSAFGDVNQHGTEGVRFWTKVKTLTQRSAQRRARWWQCVRHPDDGVNDMRFAMIGTVLALPLAACGGGSGAAGNNSQQAA
ncbi:aldehyde dehydrogenase family protein, partial [Escherichia coli]|nr:aldehyde dehydrogenase family protein [Escherichia coli]